MELLIVTNGPGEITTWVRPVIRAIKEKGIKIRITSLLTPCQFATGQELHLLSQIKGIDKIIPPHLYPRLFLKGRSNFGKGVLLHLGGDPIHSLLLARRLNLKAAIYTYGPPRHLLRGFDKVMVLDNVKKEEFAIFGIPERKIDVVGELITDSVEDLPYAPHHELIGLLPGSRRIHFLHLVQFLSGVCEGMIKRIPSIHFLLLMAQSLGPKPGIPNLKRTMVVREGIEVMRKARFVITIPGSNTGQLAALGVPMLVILPLHLPHLIPLPGIGNLLGKIPFIGRSIKGRLVKREATRGFISIPNIRANRSVVPEMKGEISPDEVALEATRYFHGLDDGKVSSELKRIMGHRGASRKVADLVLSMMG